jgi:hypothetical protein
LASSSHASSGSISASSASRDYSTNYVELIAGLHNQTRFSGQKARLRCVFEGQPKPRIRWLKNEAPLETQVSSSKVNLQEHKLSANKYEARLRINDLDTHDSGFYKCRATLPHGRITESVGVLVVNRIQIDERERTTSDHSRYTHSSASSITGSIEGLEDHISVGHETDLDQITNEITPPVHSGGSIRHSLDTTDVGISFVPNTPDFTSIAQG